LEWLGSQGGCSGAGASRSRGEGGSWETGGVRACVHDIGVVFFLGGGRCGERGGGTGVVGSWSIPLRGNRPGRAVPVTGRLVFIAIGTSGWRGNTSVEYRS